MSEKNTGGPAFPSHGSMGEVAHEGMSLRDWFAGKAMELHIQRDIAFRVDERSLDQSAKHAYAFADAMLRAREA